MADLRSHVYYGPTDTTELSSVFVKPLEDTLWKIFDLAFSKYTHQPCCYHFPLAGEIDTYGNYKPSLIPVPTTYATFKSGVLGIASCLDSYNLRIGDRVGIFSSTRKEWMMAFIACQRQGITVVPICDSLSSGDVEHIAKETEMTVCFVENVKLLEILLKVQTKIKVVILMEWCDNETVQMYRRRNIDLIEFNHARKQKGIPLIAKPTTKDTAVIMYSYETGRPKGVQMTHSNFVHAIDTMQHRISIGPTDRMLKTMPFGYIFEMMIEIVFFSHGGSIYYTKQEWMKHHLFVVKPTIFVSAPRIFEQLKRIVAAKINGGTGVENYESNCCCSCIRPVLYSGSRKALGLDNLRHVEICGAICRWELEKWIAKFLGGTPVIQSYQVIETNGNGFVQLNPSMPGYVGVPSGCKVMLKSVPEMGFMAGNNKGEIIFKGPTVCSYFRNQQATAAAIKDGWLYTGYIGEGNPENNVIKIIGKKKDFFALGKKKDFFRSEKRKVD